MYNTAFFKFKNNKKVVQGIEMWQFLAKYFFLSKSKSIKQEAGFTLIEILVVVVMVGVLAAIVGPSWLAFVSTQRVNKANDTVLSAIQEAQRLAKNTKRDYSVSFKVNSNQEPEIAIHPDSEFPVHASRWKPLGADVGVESKQILLGTNLVDIGTATVKKKNTVKDPGTVFFNNLTDQRKITFDYMGILEDAYFGPIPTTDPKEAPGLKIVVTVPQAGNRTQPGGVKRCVILQTLIGGMRTAKDGECN